MLHLSLTHPAVRGRLFHWDALVALVCFGGLTHHTDGQLLLLTEEFELLPVLGAQLPAGLGRLPLSSGLGEGVTEVPERQVGRRVAPRAASPAHRAAARGRGALPEALQTPPAEAVAAGQQDGVPEDVTAHRTTQVLLWQGQPR